MSQNQAAGVLAGFAGRVSDFLPTLAVGLLLIGLGLVAGWVAKRVVIRVLIWLRLDRLAGRVGWRAAFSKGDVRAALYNLLGTLAMLLVVLIFLDNALELLGLTVVSRMLDRLVFYVPNLGLVGVIVGVGVLVSNAVAEQVEEALEEEFHYARLIAKLVKGVLLSIVTAIALWQLDLAREIVLTAFLIGFGAVGVAFALSVGLGSAKIIQHGWEKLFEERKDKE
ncbi:MAG TPA: hypothetical protein VLD58_06935 [Gemmatimonadales bacterium]|nr:hypothetical protein [Gemmatimonadales bacterium]HSB70059.1 hypothetical protein [Candidatus Methylomirabilis sp.]